MPADEEISTALVDLGSATLGESGAQAMRARISAAWPGARLAAPALPVRCTPGDNLAVHVAITHARAGDALVVDVGDLRELGYWGEVLTTAAQSRRVAGLVIDGGVRDVHEIQALRFPVFSAMIALRGAVKRHAGFGWCADPLRRRSRRARRLGRGRRRRGGGRTRRGGG